MTGSIENIFYKIYSTPNFKNQMKLIDTILENKEIHLDLFKYTISKFDKIESDRKDKFYYLICKIIELNESITLDQIVMINSTTLMREILLRRDFFKCDDQKFVLSRVHDSLKDIVMSKILKTEKNL